MIAPIALIPLVDAVAASFGQAGGQLTQPWGQSHLMGAFPPTRAMLDNLGSLPPQFVVVDLDADVPAQADPAKVNVFLSGRLDGVPLGDTARSIWPQDL
jgi:hypothetical protein